MGRLRFVQPSVVRLQLADVHVRAYDALKNHKGKKKASKEELAAAKQAVEEAVADGAWIEVKRELNASEARRVFARMVRAGVTPGEQMSLDPEKVGLTKVVEYLVDWSFADASGEPVAVSEDAIGNLDQETFREVLAAVEWHDEQSERARADRKNGQGGARESSATSASLSGQAGPSTLSAH